MAEKDPYINHKKRALVYLQSKGPDATKMEVLEYLIRKAILSSKWSLESINITNLE